MSLNEILPIIVGLVAVGLLVSTVRLFQRLSELQAKQTAQSEIDADQKLQYQLLEQRHGELSNRFEVQQTEFAQVQTQLHDAQRQRDLLTQRLEMLKQLEEDKSSLESRLSTTQDAYSQLQQEYARLSTLLDQERKTSSEKLQLLEEAKEKLRLEFQTLANRIFEEKGEKLQKNQQSALETTLTPLRDQLSDFRRKVEEVYDKESKERVSLLSEIVHLKSLNQQISQDAINLTKALKGESKTQGNWGEVILERVLEESGLRKGREYDVQQSLKDEAGRRMLPDVIVRLPNEKDIIIDSKVSLTDYERYCSAEGDDQRDLHLRSHIQSLRKHIDTLSKKNYDNLDGLRSLDFVFLFVPIEAAFLVAVEHDPDMFSAAYDKHIIIVSPTTLLATLRTVESIWRYERQNRNAEKIAAEAGALHDKFVGLLESLEDIGKHIHNAEKSYDLTLDRLSRGKGNLMNRVTRLERLGAKTKKKAPEHLLDELSSDVELIATEDAETD